MQPRGSARARLKKRPAVAGSMKFASSAIAIMLAATSVALLTPPAAAECAVDCIEDCHVTVKAFQAGAGCTLFHQRYEEWTPCVLECGPIVLRCHAYDDGKEPDCQVSSLDALLQPRCQQVFVGPDIDQGLCYDLGRDTCQVWWYDTYGTGGGDRCLT